MGARVTQPREPSEARERPAEVMYAESVRRFNARRYQDLCWEWLRHHERLLRSHQTTAAILTAHHRQEIARYEKLLGIDESKGKGNGKKTKGPRPKGA